MFGTDLFECTRLVEMVQSKSSHDDLSLAVVEPLEGKKGTF